MNFSIRQMLLAMIGFALISAVVAAGVNGSAIAYGIGISLCSLSIYFLCFALLHRFALLIAGKANDTPPMIEPETSSESRL